MKTTVILDLEWTSWKYNVDRKWQKKEIIQIGAIKINNKYKIIGEINIYVKPKFNPILSNYIKKLTGITQNKIDNNENILQFVIKKSPNQRLFMRWQHLSKSFGTSYEGSPSNTSTICKIKSKGYK